MVYSITKVGDSLGIVFDQALVERLHLQAGKEVELYLEDETIVIIPCDSVPDEKVRKATRHMMAVHRETLDKLAQ